MQDTESDKKPNDPNGTLLSDFAATKRQSRSLYRIWATVSKSSAGNSVFSQKNVFSKISTSSIGYDLVEHRKESSCISVDDRVDEIVRHIEQTHALVDDNPKSNNDRIETLRSMTECLTLKRSVKQKLTKSKVSTNQTLGFSKRLKYSMSLFFFKIPVAIRHFTSSFELWYSSLKVIEGHFGSNVASYFKFLRKLFLLNACIFTLMFFFVMIPQLLFRLFQYVDDSQILDSTFNLTSVPNQTRPYLLDGAAEFAPLVMVKANPYEENGEFRLGNIFTGEGFLTNTILFYGYYTNTSLQLIKGVSYSIPAAYFFTSAVCYSCIFCFLFISVAVSYRKCYIEASGGMHNTFTNKVFCGWDFGIATSQAADLKSSSIFIEIKELLDDLSKPKKKRTCVDSFYTTAISFSLNALLLFLLGVGGMYSWKYLDQEMSKVDTATTMMMWLILTLVIALAPVLFSLVAHFEGFESPSTALYMTLIRTFSLYAIVIAVVVAYRLNRSSESECWETILGQDMFRLVVLDFIFGSIGTALSEFIRYRIHVKMWPGIGCPEFDIARSTMNLIYNQTLFYVGLFFSPVLSLLITVKLFVIFYIKKWGAIYNCKSSVRPWKASQAHTVYLSIAFFAFFCVVIAFGYIITSVKTSNCGPFRGERYMYEKLLEEISAKRNLTILMVLYYISRPGVVGIALMAMFLGVYYMRAVALARIHVVKHLRHLLRLKAEDRKVLLNEIAKYLPNQDPRDSGARGDFLAVASGGSRGDFLAVTSGGEISESLEHSRGVGRKKLSDGDEIQKARGLFSSMINLQGENSLSEVGRSNVFSSTQNVSSCDPQPEEDLRCDFNKFKKNNENPCDESRSLTSENVKTNEESPSPGGHSLGDSSKVPDNNETAEGEVSGKDDWIPYGYGCQLNFNPVFTESVPLTYDEELEDFNNMEDFNNTSSIINREYSSYDEEKPLTDGKATFPTETIYLKNILKDEDRVPSRISFTQDRKTPLPKKNH